MFFGCFCSLASGQNLKISAIVVGDSLGNVVTKRNFYRRTFDTAIINNTINRVVSRYADTGFPFARAVCDSAVVKNAAVTLYYSVTSGQRFIVNNIFMPQCPKISKHYIYRTVFIRPFNDFSHARFTKTVPLINNTGIITAVKPSAVEFYPDGADIYLYIQKLKANSAEAGVALMYDDVAKKYYPAGNASLVLNNNLGYGEYFGFDWRGYNRNSQKLSVETRLPYLFGSVFSPSGRVKINKCDSSSVYVEIVPELGVTVSDALSASVAVAFNSVMPQESGELAVKTKEMLYGVGAQWFSVCNNGVVKLGAEASLGTRTANGEKNPSQEICFEALFKRNFARFLEFDLKTDSKLKFCNATTSLYEKYRFGGARLLRGFNEDYFYADMYGIMSNTLRFNANGGVGVFLFCDMAYYRCQNTNTTLHDTPLGVGIGTTLTQRNTDIDVAWALGREYGAFLPIRQAKLHITVKVKF